MRRVLKVGLIRLWGVVEGVARGNKVEDFLARERPVRLRLLVREEGSGRSVESKSSKRRLMVAAEGG